LFGSCSGSLIDKKDTSNTTTFMFLSLRGRSNIIISNHMGSPDIIHLSHLTGHFEIHDVAAIIPIYVDNTLLGIDMLCYFINLVGTRALKNTTNGTPV
jgi:hypothetical protein